MSITVGLVGCGRWGRNHHATLSGLKASGYLDRLVLCDIDPAVLAAHAADAHYTSLEAMLANETLSAVAIVTPPQTHLSLAELVMAHDLPMFIEKPLGLNPESEQRFLTNLPHASTLVVGYLLRHHAGMKRILSAVAARDLEVETLLYRRRTVRLKPEDADPVTTLAVHGLDTAQLMTGTPLTSMDVQSMKVTATSADIRLQHNGITVIVDVAWEADEEERLLDVNGPLNRAVLDFGTGIMTWGGSGVADGPTTEHHPSQPLKEEWLYFLQSIASGQSHVFPDAASLLDLSAWLADHGPAQHDPR